MTNHPDTISVAIETSCRRGSVALGVGAELRDSRDLGTTRKHAAALLPVLDDMLREASLSPVDVNELYVSVGPGSFTGLRVGMSVARTWGQQLADLRIVAVPTPLAVAENIPEDWPHLAVLLAAKQTGDAAGTVYGALLKQDDDGAAAFDGEPCVARPAELLAAWPRPLLLTGEGVGFCNLPAGDDVTLADESLHLPTARGVWTTGRRLAAAQQFTPWNHLQVVYARRPEAVRLWEKRHGPA